MQDWIERNPPILTKIVMHGPISQHLDMPLLVPAEEDIDPSSPYWMPA